MKRCQSRIQPAINAVSASRLPSLSLSPPTPIPSVSTVCSGGWRWLRVAALAATSATCSSSCVWFLLCFCLVRARQSQQQFETSTKPFKLLFAFVALFDFRRGGVSKLAGRGCNPFEKLCPERENSRSQKYVTKMLAMILSWSEEKRCEFIRYSHWSSALILDLPYLSPRVAHQNRTVILRTSINALLHKPKFEFHINLNFCMQKISLVNARERERERERVQYSFNIVDCIFNIYAINIVFCA